MNAKEYLSQAYVLDRRVKVAMENVAHLREMTQQITPNYESEVVSHTRNVSSLQDTITKLVDAEEQLNRNVNTLVALKKEITGVLAQVRNPEYKLLLEMRYLAFKGWDEIADNLYMHVRSAHKMHSRALKVVDAIINAPAFESVLKEGT